MKVLITGASGYIGKAVAVNLSENNHSVVLVDNNADFDMENISNSFLYLGNISDREVLKSIIDEHPDIEVVIHCLELSAVSLSVKEPYEYYLKNVVQGMEMLKALSDFGIKKLVFASSAAIYADVAGYLATEASPLNPRSPFGRTKLIMETMLRDFCEAYGFKAISLRYFNPIGAFGEGRFGRDHKNSTNLMSQLISYYYGEINNVVICGTDWSTRDGTCVRDYVHISDAAEATFKAAVDFDLVFERAGQEASSFVAINIGSGLDVTVKEFIIAFENVTGEKVEVSYRGRREGDIGGSYAGVRLAKRLLEWEPVRSLEEAIIDELNWAEKTYK